MAVHDRDYMRSRSRAPLLDGTSWTIRVVILLVVVFIVQRMFPGFDRAAPLSWERLTEGKVWTLVTAAITHADFNHLIGNLIGVYFFGRIAEEELGSPRFLRLSILTGVLGWLPFLIAQIITGDPIPTLGASGVVMAYLAVATLRRPKTTFLFWMIVPIPLWILAVLYVGSDLAGLSGQLRGGGTGVNHVVHMTGVLFGLGAHFIQRGGMPSLPGLSSSDEPAQRSRQSARNAPGYGKPGRLDPHSPEARDEVNRLLDKISDEGIGSLSDEEREFLNSASRGYR